MSRESFVPAYEQAVALRDEVQFRNIELTNLDDRPTLRFEVTWNDSWRFRSKEGAGNWDAVWVFVKLSAPNRMSSFPRYLPGTWGPAHFETDAGQAKGPPEAKVQPGEDGLGLFVYRRAPGRGTADFKGIEIPLASSTAEFIAEADEIDLVIFGLRMVYIPAGPFWLGDPLGPEGPMNCFYSPLRSGEENQCLEIGSEDAITVGPERQLYYQGDVYGGDRQGPIPAAFPKGYEAFYVMRQHVTQFQYARFINLLPPSARTIRYPYLGEGAFRFSIFNDRSDERSATRGMRPCNYLAWADGAAFADWAGLRPMSEFEMTKASRGFAPPVAGEFVWGNTHIELAQIILGDEASTMVVTGNCNIGNSATPFTGGDGGQGPVPSDSMLMRTTPDAVFFLNGSKPVEKPESSRIRQESGASYFGVMGLSGNLWEYCVSAGNETGRAFTGTNGNGDLDASGDPNLEQLKWPGLDGRGISFRGGSWYTAESLGRLADRTYGAGLPNYVFRSHDTGIRCARTAPKGGEDDA